MDLTDRLTRALLGTLTLGAVLVPAAVAAGAAAAQPVPGGGGELTTPTTDPCGPDGCLPPDPEPEPEPECPPFVATCGDVTGSQCDPVEEDCSPGPECPADADCPDPCAEDPDAEGCPGPDPCADAADDVEAAEDVECPGPGPEPQPEPVDPSLPGDPDFTG